MNRKELKIPDNLERIFRDDWDDEVEDFELISQESMHTDYEKCATWQEVIVLHDNKYWRFEVYEWRDGYEIYDKYMTEVFPVEETITVTTYA